MNLRAVVTDEFEGGAGQGVHLYFPKGWTRPDVPSVGYGLLHKPLEFGNLREAIHYFCSGKLGSYKVRVSGVVMSKAKQPNLESIFGQEYGNRPKIIELLERGNVAGRFWAAPQSDGSREIIHMELNADLTRRMTNVQGNYNVFRGTKYSRRGR